MCKILVCTYICWLLLLVLSLIHAHAPCTAVLHFSQNRIYFIFRSLLRARQLRRFTYMSGFFSSSSSLVAIYLNCIFCEKEIFLLRPLQPAIHITYDGDTLCALFYAPQLWTPSLSHTARLVESLFLLLPSLFYSFILSGRISLLFKNS